jgi:3-phenylpropionate/cinnamic acid dioxygenase small subunit
MNPMSLREEIEHFYYLEADVLDERRWDEWLDLLDDELVYFMPLQRNVRADDLQREASRIGVDIAWFDEDKWTLAKRVEQLKTGIHWAEEPLSRVSHLVTNIQIQEFTVIDSGSREVATTNRFLIYQNRVERETAIFCGKRRDRLRDVGAGWRLLKREITLDQNVLLAKNLTVFF